MILILSLRIYAYVPSGSQIVSWELKCKYLKLAQQDSLRFGFSKTQNIIHTSFMSLKFVVICYSTSRELMLWLLTFQR